MYKIGQFSRVVGVPVRTLHTWERRYGILSPHRGRAGHRLYDERSVLEARCVLGLMDGGVSLGSIQNHPTYAAFKAAPDSNTSGPEGVGVTPVSDAQMMEIIGRIQRDITVLASHVAKPRKYRKGEHLANR